MSIIRKPGSGLGSGPGPLESDLPLGLRLGLEEDKSPFFASGFQADEARIMRGPFREPWHPCGQRVWL